MPATSATSELSFSSLRHIETYLRTTMRQDRLNHLMMLYIHKDRKVNVMKEFVLCNDERKYIFGISNVQIFRGSAIAHSTRLCRPCGRDAI